MKASLFSLVLLFPKLDTKVTFFRFFFNAVSTEGMSNFKNFYAKYFDHGVDEVKKLPYMNTYER